MGRQMPWECQKCRGLLDWGDFGSEDERENKPTCTCVEWVWDGVTWDERRDG